MEKHISSVQNSWVKKLIQIQEKSRERKKSGLFLVEGVREVSIALKAGYEIESLIYCPELTDNQSTDIIFSQINDNQKVSVTKEVYQKLAYREKTEGIIAVVYAKKHDLSTLNLPENPLILVAESIEKPGNIGALLRTADAAAVDAVILADPKTDLYNPNVIRSSVGGVFTNQIAAGTSEEVIDYLKEKNIRIFSAILQEAVDYSTQDYKQGSAIVVGTEATGLSDIWRKHSTQNIIVPMEGVIDSMNVSVAASVLIFEAKRQRR
ncbi:TrmH family RNA methyltransferase [Avrilella dinanensis]|uniref:TrmH family RNA methyltransferase n=1 Tax=Avrilella dinanensis TaxID=2008672 RepID=UPI0024094593|nr:RNA methyltransferase [Avrilella dinanensis]